MSYRRGLRQASADPRGAMTSRARSRSRRPTTSGSRRYSSGSDWTREADSGRGRRTNHAPLLAHRRSGRSPPIRCLKAGTSLHPRGRLERQRGSRTGAADAWCAVDRTAPAFGNLTPSGWISDLTPSVTVDVRDRRAGLGLTRRSWARCPSTPSRFCVPSTHDRPTQARTRRSSRLTSRTRLHRPRRRRSTCTPTSPTLPSILTDRGCTRRLEWRSGDVRYA